MICFRQLLFFLLLLTPLVKVYADEDNSKSSSIQLKVSLKQDLMENKQTVKEIKIDKNMNAKITISSTPIIKEADILKKDIDNLSDKIEKSEQNQQNSVKEAKKENILEQPKNQNKEEIKKNTQENNLTEQNIIINGNEKSTFTIKDGIKNININFQPNIINKTKQPKQVNNKNLKNKKVTVKKTFKKNNKKTIKTNDAKKAINTNAKQTYNYNDLTSKNNTANDTEGNIVIIDKTKEKEDESQTKQKDVNNENRAQNQKTTNNKHEKQDIYIINRIINVDENTPLTEETLKQLNAKQTSDDKDVNIKIIQENNDAEKIKTNNDKNTNNKQLTAYKYDKSENKFKQRYDLITANHISYGEMAFVKDYNN